MLNPFAKGFLLFPCILFFINMIMLWNLCRYYRSIYYSSQIPPKYILNWNKKCYLNALRLTLPFSRLKCKYSNCILTDNKNLFLGDYKRFDAIVFMEDDLKIPLKTLRKTDFRASTQLYIFFTIESAANRPACEVYNDNFFNWTFTSRLDSDIVWNYFIVQNATGHIIAPNVNVDWYMSENPISPKIKAIWQGRTKAAAWLVSNCKADSLRHHYVTKLQESLYHFSLQIDIFGKCTNRQCPNDDFESMLARDYYFYIAFENSFSDDYVTEKVLHGYDNYVVPIVYGAANYNRFLPPGSYINARELHPYHVAFLIHEAMNDKNKYETYFNWTNFYTIIDKTPEYNPMCSLCETLNTDKAKHAPAYSKFRMWWNKPAGMKWCLSDEYWNETSLVNEDERHVFKMY